MNKVEELEYEIEKLPNQEYEILRDWFLEKEWKKWDEDIEQDSSSGKLDFLIDEAQAEKNRAALKDI